MSSSAKYSQCVRALDTAVLDLCDAAVTLNEERDLYTSSRARAEQTIQDVTHRVHRQLAKFSRNHNRTLPIMRLPPELLVVIFEWLPALQDIVRACYVCHDWHYILMYTAPAIWSHVVWRSKRQGALTALLLRSAAADLNLDIRITRYNWKEACLCLQKHLSRSVFVRLQIDQKLRYNAKQELARVLSLPAPRLRTFRLLDAAENYISVNDDPLPLFCGLARCLQFVKMHVDFQTLAGVVLPSVKSVLVANTDAMCADDVTIISKAFPEVESMAIEIDQWNHAIEAGDLVQVPRSVKDLVIISNAAVVDPRSLLKQLDYRSIPHVCISYNKAVKSEDAAAMLAELASFSRVRCMRINTSALSLLEHELNVDMWPEKDRSRPQRTMLDLPVGARPSGQLFANLTCLLVGELVLAVGEPFPPAESLLELTVQMLAPEYQAEDGHNSVFLLPLDRQRVLSCPSLRKLTFGSRRHAHATRLAPHLALDFVRFHLDAPVLETLSIKGLELLTTILDDAAELVALAPNFEMEDDCIIEPDRKDDLLAWS